MSISARTILVGQLSDGRLQVWAQAGSDAPGGVWAGEVFSRWKISTDPNSSWTDWQPFDATYNGQQIALLATSIYPTLQSQLFGMTGDGVLVWTLKASEDPNSDWLPWTPFNNPPPGGNLIALQNFTAACLGTSSAAYTA